MDKIQGHSTSNASSISQYAAMAALNGSQYVVEEMRAVYEERRAYVQGQLKKKAGVQFTMEEGALYFCSYISGC